MPRFGADAETVETLQQRVFSVFRQPRQFFLAIFDPTRRPFALREKFPGGIKTFFPGGHSPSRMTFIQKGFTPLDHLAVNMLVDMGAKDTVTPVGQQVTRSKAEMRDRSALMQWRFQRRRQLLCQRSDQIAI